MRRCLARLNLDDRCSAYELRTCMYLFLLIIGAPKNHLQAKDSIICITLSRDFPRSGQNPKLLRAQTALVTERTLVLMCSTVLVVSIGA